MKRIVGGKMYNTATAEFIVEASNGLPYSDFGHWEAKLYVTKKGRFFLAGEGGPMSRWGVAALGGGTGGSVGIIPLDREEAAEWAESFCSTALYEKYFTVEEA